MYVSLFSKVRTNKVNCHLSFVITKLSLTFPKISRHIRRLNLNDWSGVFLTSRHLHWCLTNDNYNKRIF